jgi:8-oxo-dGTP diphosphatase
MGTNHSRVRFNTYEDNVTSMANKNTLHVVAAALFNIDGDVLIAERPAGKGLAGYWEFPGGKLESGETPYQALARELWEELGIELLDAHPLIRFPYEYPDRRVLLDVWRATQYRGEPRAREGQTLAWVRPAQLRDFRLLPANGPIVTALRLPTAVLVTPEPGADEDGFLAALEESLAAGIRLVQFRAHGIESARFADLAAHVAAHCHQANAWCVINAAPKVACAAGADGVHLSAAHLMQCKRRPLDTAYWVGASCHSAAEIRHAAALRLDYILVGPVLPTLSHPGREPLGWPAFARLIEDCNVPVYALGGMRRGHLKRAREAGAQGIAAIRSLWR